VEAGPRLAVVDLDPPVAGAGEVLVRMRASGLNRADVALGGGGHAAGPAGITGREVAGEVEAVGAGVEGVAVGDRVMAMAAGAWAELVAVDARLCVPVPEGWSWAEAGATPVVYATAHDALVTNGGLARGESVLIPAVSSGVGVAALQIAKAMGAGTVIGTSRSPEKLAALAPLGLDVGIDVRAGGLADAVRAATGGRGADVVVDNVGGPAFADVLDATALLGRIVQVGRLGGRTAEVDLDLLAYKRVRLIGVTFRTRTPDERVAVLRAFVDDLGDDLVAGRLRPLVHATWPLEAAPAALEALQADRHVGKLVLTAGA
jgi:NADPH:quinone reductase-like Zn-dependent oxidoreductase